MKLKLQRVKYRELNARQQELYNFQKVAAVLAEFGYNCIRLSDDWQGADFLAYHFSGEETLKVQLKGRATIQRSYIGKNLYMTFPHKGDWYLVPHDELVDIFDNATNGKALQTVSWMSAGKTNRGKLSKLLLKELEPYRLG